MKTLAFYSAMDQSSRKFKQASHTLSFLHMISNVPVKKLNRLSLRNAIKLAKKEGYDYNKNWRDYTVRRETHPFHNKTISEQLILEKESDALMHAFIDVPQPELLSLKPKSVALFPTKF